MDLPTHLMSNLSPPLEDVLRFHQVNAEAIDSNDIDRVEIWVATASGVLRIWYLDGDPHGALPTAQSDMTAWGDVRDIELSGVVAQMNASDPHNELGHSTEVTLLVGFPKLRATSSGIGASSALVRFAGVAMRHSNESR